MQICKNGHEAGINWLNNGWLKVVGQKRLRDIKPNEHFIYKKEFCTMIASSAHYCSWENAIRNEFCTSRTDIVVAQVEFVDEVQNV